MGGKVPRGSAVFVWPVDFDLRSERIQSQNRFPAQVPYPIQERSHHRDGKLEVCPVRERAEQRKYEREIEEKFEVTRGKVIGLRSDPIGE